MSVAAALFPLPAGAPRPVLRLPSWKSLAQRRQPVPKTKPPRSLTRALPELPGLRSPDGTQAPEKKNTTQPWEGGAWGGDGSLGPSGHRRRGVPAEPRFTPSPRSRGGAAHLNRGSRCGYQRVRSRRPGHPSPPRGHPQQWKGQTVPESDVRGGAECREKEGGRETALEPKPPQRREQEE